VNEALAELRDAWDARWSEALAAWSKLTRLTPPRWCLSVEDETREGLADTFAQIRLADHVVVLSARKLHEAHLEPFPLEIMAHEIGHHVYCPGDLSDYGRLMARVRRGLPGKQRHAPMVANLYEDLLINDRLQRSAGLDMAGVWRALAGDGASTRLWALYTSIYEHLWSLPRGDLSRTRTDERTDLDAALGARLARVYARDWLRGGGRFAALVFPYLEDEGAGPSLKGLMDTGGQSTGTIPDGLAEVDGDEDDAVHPAFDPELSGMDAPPDPRTRNDGRRTLPRHRDVGEYGELLRAMGVNADASEVAARYYRERALPHLVRFPTRRSPAAVEPLPEGLDLWDAGSPLERIDWVESIVRSPHVIPGVTTLERTYGDAPGRQPRRAPVDLYVGIDCSGSMPAPRQLTSFPALAGTIVSLSALRAGARVKVVLSGEPQGRTYAMPEFVRDERAILAVLTDYLGTGFGFGVHRLADTFDGRTPRDRPVHVMLLSDHDLFRMFELIEEDETGWDVARRALLAARGGGTVVLNMVPGPQHPGIERLRADGWRVHCVSGWEELVDFAREFSRRVYEEEKRA
jgi:hypothetical protein